MKSLAKNIGKLNQLMGEKLYSAHKHDLSEEFKQLESQLEIRKDGTDALLHACNQYLHTIEKRKEGVDKHKHISLANLGIAMLQYGANLDDGSAYGQALLKMGETEKELGNLQEDYAQKLRECFTSKLESFLADMKQHKYLRSKLESRRLDYDAKQNKLTKVKKENPNLDEELRQAQQKYEETLTEVELLIISLSQREAPQLEGLFRLADAQVEYHRKALMKAEELRRCLADPSIRVTPAAASILKSTTSIYQSASSVMSSPQLHHQSSPLRSTQNISVAGPYFDSPVTSTGNNLLGFTQISSHHGSSTSGYQLNDPTNYETISHVSKSLDRHLNITSRNGNIYNNPTFFDQSSSIMTTPQSTISNTNNNNNNSNNGNTNALLKPSNKLLRVNYNFTAEQPNDLSLAKGDIITVISEFDPGWWWGELNGRQGMFPVNYCQLIAVTGTSGMTPSSIPTTTTQQSISNSPAIQSPLQYHINNNMAADTTTDEDDNTGSTNSSVNSKFYSNNNHGHGLHHAYSLPRFMVREQSTNSIGSPSNNNINWSINPAASRFSSVKSTKSNNNDNGDNNHLTLTNSTMFQQPQTSLLD